MYSSRHHHGRYGQVLEAFAPAVTPYIESQLAHVGRVRVDEQLRRGVHKINSITMTKNVMTSHIQVDDTLWMQGSVEMYGKVLDVHRFLLGHNEDMHAMRSLFGEVFLDGYVLRSLASGGPHERMRVTWMALQAPHTSFNDRDYVFLQYADVYVRDHDQLRQETQTTPANPALLTASHVWESVDLDGVPPLDSLGLTRQRISSWGFLVEAIDNGRVRVTMTVNQPKASAPHRSWMDKLVVALHRLEGLLYDHFDNGPCCHACTKTFTLLRRRLQCKQCKMSYCSKCAAPGGDLVVICRGCASRADNHHVSSTPILLQRSSSTPSTKSGSRNLSLPLKPSSSMSSDTTASMP